MNVLKQFITDRPLSVTIASIFVLSITAWSGIRACMALINWDVLSRFNGNPIYIFVSGLAWFISGLVLFLIIFHRKPSSLHAGLILSMIYMLWYWFDRTVIQSSPTSNVVFSVIASMILLVIFNAVLFWPSSKAFFTNAGQTYSGSPGTRRQDE
jgi:hypothetical protein